MKNTLLLLFLLGICVIPAFSEELKLINPQADLPPKWTDFCETGYENAVYKNRDDVFNVFSYVKSERTKTNYWAERRVSFEKYLKSCNELDDSAKAECYAKLRKSENEKNDLYKLKRTQMLYENNIQLNRH